MGKLVSRENPLALLRELVAMGCPSREEGGYFSGDGKPVCVYCSGEVAPGNWPKFAHKLDCIWLRLEEVAGV